MKTWKHTLCQARIDMVSTQSLYNDVYINYEQENPVLDCIELS